MLFNKKRLMRKTFRSLIYFWFGENLYENDYTYKSENDNINTKKSCTTEFDHLGNSAYDLVPVNQSKNYSFNNLEKKKPRNNKNSRNKSSVKEYNSCNTLTKAKSSRNTFATRSSSIQKSASGIKSRSRLRKFEKSLKKWRKGNRPSSLTRCLNRESSNTMYPYSTCVNSEFDKVEREPYKSWISEKSKSRHRTLKPDISVRSFVKDK